MNISPSFDWDIDPVKVAGCSLKKQGSDRPRKQTIKTKLYDGVK